MEPKDDPTPAEITKEEVDALLVQAFEEESPPPLGINVVECISAKEKLK